MSREICPVCAGSGEGAFLVQPEDPSDGSCVLGACWACHGKGFKSPFLLKTKSGPAIARRATKIAVKTILTLMDETDEHAVGWIGA